MKNFNFKSRKGFTLIELLVVIGILAVLAAIAIPSVAGLIDRANVSADKTNANEMTNAIERFTSEYELYCQDIASGALTPDNLDSAQGRVKNVIGVTTRSGIEGIEFAQNATVADDIIAIYRDTKYPMNAYTMQKVVENYTKTSSSTFEPKQSDMHFWYSPDCGVVVVAEPTKTAAELDKYVISGMDAKGNDISGADRDAKWIDLTDHSNQSTNIVNKLHFRIRLAGASTDTTYELEENMTWRQWVNSPYNTDGWTIEGDGIFIPNNCWIDVGPFDTIEDWNYIAGYGISPDDAICPNAVYATRP